ncbi:ParB N-terminal domain-containing protein [bacterium]|nr:ParB N-terminal domain-containing protein [bacterium]
MDTKDKFVESKVVMMPVDKLKAEPPFCEVFDIRESDLQQVIEAIRDKGFDTLYPIVVWDGHDNVIVDGHTRLVAAKQLGYSTVPVVPRVFANEEEALQHTIAAQRVRRALSQAELMKCVAVMREKMAARKTEQSVKGLTPVPQGRTTQVIAEAVGSTRGTVDKIERITRNGNPKLIEAVRNDELSINQAHEIVKRDERKKRQLEYAEEVMGKNAPANRERFFLYRGFAEKISNLYAEFLKTYHDEFRDREMCEFDWSDLRQQLIRGLDRDLICHLGKTGEADRAIQYSATQEGYEEGLDYYYEKHHKEWDEQHVVTE